MIFYDTNRLVDLPFIVRIIILPGRVSSWPDSRIRRAKYRKFEVYFLRWWFCVLLLNYSCDDKIFRHLFFFGRRIDSDSLTEQREHSKHCDEASLVRLPVEVGGVEVENAANAFGVHVLLHEWLVVEALMVCGLVLVLICYCLQTKYPKDCQHVLGESLCLPCTFFRSLVCWAIFSSVVFSEEV